MSCSAGSLSSTITSSNVTRPAAIGPGSIAAFSITQDAILTIWNVVLGLVVMLWAFGFDQVKRLLWHKGTNERVEPLAPCRSA